MTSEEQHYPPQGLGQQADLAAVERTRWKGPAPSPGRGPDEIRLEWHTEPPRVSSYYLAAWRRGNSWHVSELWFSSTGWWSSRGYLGQAHSLGIAPMEVTAWAPMPVYHPPAGDGS